MKSLYKILLIFVLIFISTISLTSYHNKISENTLSTIDPTLKRSLLLTPELIEEYNIKLKEILIKHDFQGNITLCLSGKLIFQQSSGYADIQNKLKNDSCTVFQLASVSKQFTAMAVAILKEKGMLSYDDFVVKYIPEFPYPDITIRHLLNHTSGLQNYVWLIENKWNKKTPPDNEDLIDMFIENPLPLNFHPGTKFSYSNTGYAFLASLIQRVSGKLYHVFLKETIFDVLGMNDTYVIHKLYADLIPNKAKGYVRRGGRYVHYEDDFNDGIVGDKGIYSTTDDLLKWDAALYSDVLVPQKSIEEMFVKNITLKGDSFNYGLGWRLPKEDNVKMVYHNGWWHGYRCTLRRYTNDKNTLIILNNTNKNIFPLVHEIENLMYPNIIQDTLLNGE